MHRRLNAAGVSPPAVGPKGMNPGAPEEGTGLRLLADWETPMDGEANMRRDRELLERASMGAGPTLRLYRWSRPTLTLGHGQTPETATDPAALAALGIAWVHRPTGGRALLHLPDELTYAFAAPRGFAPGVRGAYFRVMGCIWTAVARFVRLDPPPAGPPPRHTHDPPPPRRRPRPATPRPLVSPVTRWRPATKSPHRERNWWPAPSAGAAAHSSSTAPFPGQ